MECGFDKEMLTLWLSEELTEAERAAVEAHIAECADCRQELEASKRMWSMMGGIHTPEPPAGTLVRFNAMLDSYKQGTSDFAKPGVMTRIKEFFISLFTIRPGFAIAYSVLLVVAGLGLGRMLTPSSTSVVAGPVAAGPTVDSKELQVLTAQVSEMREMMMKSLLQNPSASDRIRGVSYTSEITTVNPGVVEALLSTLNNDQNVNVRLITLEALTHYASNPSVRAGLVESIPEQESPLVQAALADVMLKLQEKNAIRPFKKLLQQKNLNNLVRSKIETAIARLS